jgi:hypothetical protein
MIPNRSYSHHQQLGIDGEELDYRYSWLLRTSHHQTRRRRSNPAMNSRRRISDPNGRAVPAPSRRRISDLPLLDRQPIAVEAACLAFGQSFFCSARARS